MFLPMALAAAGTSLGVMAVQAWGKYRRSSDALCLLRGAPSPRFGNIRGNNNDVVIIQGLVRWNYESDSAPRKNVLRYHDSVIVERTQKIVKNLNEDNWLIGMCKWTLRLLGVFNNNNICSYSYVEVPFELIEGYTTTTPFHGITVKLDGSSQPLPLTTRDRRLRPIQDLSSFSGNVGILDELKTLSNGTRITAVGTCVRRRYFFLTRLEIEPSPRLPYFLTEMTKTEMVEDLTVKTNVLFRNVILIGSASIGLLAYVAVRSWWRWEEWRRAKRRTHESNEGTMGTENLIENDGLKGDD